MSQGPQNPQAWNGQTPQIPANFNPRTGQNEAIIPQMQNGMHIPENRSREDLAALKLKAQLVKSRIIFSFLLLQELKHSSPLPKRNTLTLLLICTSHSNL